MSTTRQQGADNLRHALAALDPEVAAPLDDRASIVAFLEREDARLVAESYNGLPQWEINMLRVKAGQCRTLAAQIVRGDDRLGGAK